MQENGHLLFLIIIINLQMHREKVHVGSECVQSTDHIRHILALASHFIVQMISVRKSRIHSVSCNKVISSLLDSMNLFYFTQR